MPAPEWFTKGSLPQWVFQATALGLIVFLVITQSRGNLAIILPLLFGLCGIGVYATKAAGKPPAGKGPEEE